MKQFRKTKEGLFICEECGNTYKNKQGLSLHINKSHNLKLYYDQFLKEENEEFCVICGKLTKFISIKNNGYSKYCSRKCITSLISSNNIEKYGNKCTLNTLNNIKKKKLTWIKNYSVDNPSKSQKIKKKKNQTTLKNYGVENPSQSISVHIKQQKSALKSKTYKNTKLYYQGSYELDFLEKYYDKFINLKRGPVIKYLYKNKVKTYFSDFYIPTLNLVIEIKNSFLYKRDKKIIKLKEKATISNGYKYIIIIDKNYDKFEKCAVNLS